MANITNAANIPAGTKTAIAEVIAAIGPQVLGPRWPEGLDAENLTAAQVAQVFELITREFWRQQVAGQKANAAAEAARKTVIDEHEDDIFT